jgi:hypothetical protein
MSRILAVVLSGCCSLFPLAAAITETPLDSALLLKELESVASSRQQKLNSDLTAIEQELNAAAASPAAALELYLKVIFATEYEGKRRDETEFVAWKKQEKETLRSAPYTLALQLHLRYLILSLHRLQERPPATLIPEILAYVDYWQNQESSFLEKDVRKSVEPFLFKPITESPFTKYYQFESQLGRLPEWEMVPGKSWSILEKSVMPSLRQQKSPQLLALWDDRILREKTQADQDPAVDKKLRFAQQTEPRLSWARAQDVYAIGQEKSALLEMMALVRTHPLHPDFEAWVQELRILLQKNSPAKVSS